MLETTSYLLFFFFFLNKGFRTSLSLAVFVLRKVERVQKLGDTSLHSAVHWLSCRAVALEDCAVDVFGTGKPKATRLE